jgi:ribonuclease P protein subunit RPR2
MTRRKISKKQQQYIAKKRIETLFMLAENKAKHDKFNQADRYVHLARKLSMKNLYPIPMHLKRKYCRSCYHYFYPGKTCRVRIHRGKIIFYCHNCHRITRIPIQEHKVNSAGMLK